MWPVAESCVQVRVGLAERERDLGAELFGVDGRDGGLQFRELADGWAVALQPALWVELVGESVKRLAVLVALTSPGVDRPHLAVERFFDLRPLRTSGAGELVGELA